MAGTLRVLTVCTHNQTRSVLMAGLLAQHADAAHLDASVLSAGFRGGGMSATDRARRLLAARGIDVGDHRSQRLDEPHVHHADLIVCAEHDHVVAIAGDHPSAFVKTFTLPELVRLAEAVGPRAGASLDEWLARIAVERTDPMGYLQLRSSAVGELADPTGSAPATWTTAFDEIDDLTGRLVAALA
ncbi:MAG: hypothetical protein WD225_03710 [Ilumatobacteraceae bacterium]